MFDHHLSDETRYQLFTRTKALAEVSMIKEELDGWIEEYSSVLEKETAAYLKHHLSNCKESISFFYLLYKIHKTQMSTKAIISGNGSLLHHHGYWIIDQLRPVTITMPGYLKSSYVLKEVIVLLTLSPGAWLSTCDCKARYPSIIIYWALERINNHIHSNNSEFKYNTDALMDALRLLMKNMMFWSGKLHYKQMMPNVSERHFGMPGQIRGLSVGARFF